MGLTLPATDDAAEVRALLGRQLRHTAKVLLRLPVSAPDPALRACHRAVVALLRGLNERSPGQLLRLLRPPSISVLVHCADDAAREGDSGRAAGHVRVLLPALLMEFARTGHQPDAVAWPLPFDALWSVPGNLHIAAPGCMGARFEPGGVSLLLSGGRVERVDLLAPISRPGVTVTAPYPLVAPGMALALADASPLALNEAHPDKDGNRVDLGGHPASEWLDALRAALEVIADTMPALRAEMDVVVQQLVPVGWDAERHLSASFKEAIGTIYLTLHPQRMTMVEALIHEFQHNKVNALAHLDPVLENAFWPLFASPVRPDPRPLWGVLLAVHAFLPVAELYRLLDSSGHPLSRSAGFRDRWRSIVAGNHSGMITLLEHARPTTAGQALLDELAALDAAHQALDLGTP